MNRLFDRFFFFGIVFILPFSCTETKIQSTDPKISYAGEYLLYEAHPFTGILVTDLPSVSIKRESSYKNGLLNGEELDLYANGVTASQRLYEDGKKVGIHKGYFPDQKPRFLYSYKDNSFHGEYWEWYNSGKVYTYAFYENGNAKVRKVWRENGDIYINYVFSLGKAYGYPGAKLCDQVRGKDGG
ncbi:toxin-antitoxin system YwqK family antitoxin [Leptospira idonii]|uniref:Membrane-binding protein n=1 Tax=Leptospira idonii TaxID=1193500 RepID=A0A4R9M3Y9_9LEPT|nr:hypothetical protein [Leptospira idonii]TGN19989.1 hypothetical protein EHS15_06335 [Leptospira idonii]